MCQCICLFLFRFMSGFFFTFDTIVSFNSKCTIIRGVSFSFCADHTQIRVLALNLHLLVFTKILHTCIRQYLLGIYFIVRLNGLWVN